MVEKLLPSLLLGVKMINLLKEVLIDWFVVSSSLLIGSFSLKGLLDSVVLKRPRSFAGYSET